MKPMLAGVATDEALIDLLAETSLLASPKLDGVRGIVKDGQLVSRSLKPIRNMHTQLLFGRPEFEGLDGELIFGAPTAEDVYRATNSAVMRIEGEPDVQFYVFDSFLHPGEPYHRREHALPHSGPVIKLENAQIESIEALEHYEQSALAAGYEGVMLRRPDAPYKFGRSTLRESYLLKLKRFQDSDAEVIGFIEEMHNANEAQTNELGRTHRSSHKENKVGKMSLGALRVRDIYTGQEFKIGTGFTATARAMIWANRIDYMGRIVKYKFLDVGVKDLPRHPVFLGWRDKDDL